MSENKIIENAKSAPVAAAPVVVERTGHMIGPQGQIIVIGAHYGLSEAKIAAGWREATKADLAAAAKRESDRKAAEAKR